MEFQVMKRKGMQNTLMLMPYRVCFANSLGSRAILTLFPLWKYMDLLRLCRYRRSHAGGVQNIREAQLDDLTLRMILWGF